MRMDRREPATTPTRGVGARWEDAALQFLLAAGLRLVERNFTCRFGEIDLVMRDAGSLVFVEVRFRDSARHGSGTLSVGPAKRTKLVRAASIWLQAHPSCAGEACRFDVVGCSGAPQAPVFEWTRAAFDAL